MSFEESWKSGVLTKRGTLAKSVITNMGTRLRRSKGVINAVSKQNPVTTGTSGSKSESARTTSFYARSRKAQTWSARFEHPSLLKEP